MWRKNCANKLHLPCISRTNNKPLISCRLSVQHGLDWLAVEQADTVTEAWPKNSDLVAAGPSDGPNGLLSGSGLSCAQWKTTSLSFWGLVVALEPNRNRSNIGIRPCPAGLYPVVCCAPGKVKKIRIPPGRLAVRKTTSLCRQVSSANQASSRRHVRSNRLA